MNNEQQTIISKEQTIIEAPVTEWAAISELFDKAGWVASLAFLVFLVIMLYKAWKVFNKRNN